MAAVFPPDAALPLGHEAQVPSWGFAHESPPGRWLAWLTRWTEYLSGAVLAADVLTVFVSVIYRYFLHDPVDWAEEVARALMIVLVFFGAATVLARSQHVGVDLFRSWLPESWQPAMLQTGHWIIAGVAASLLVSS
ncbi:MAG: putative gluconate family transporter, DctM subunit, partial [Ramlibacter sp.]|nr:putative gluconate family transporter, DctM subunit [Ramlibacter sp.]